MENNTKSKPHISESSFFKRFLSKAEEYLKQPSRVKELLNDAYQKASEKKDFGTIAHEVLESLSTLSRLIKAAVSKEYTGIPTSTLVGGVAVIIYFLSPIDVIPDWIPVIGFIDDVSLLAWFMTSIKDEMDKFAVWEASRPGKTNAEASASTHSSTNMPTATPTTLSADSSPHTTKATNEAPGQYGTAQETAPSTSGVGSSASAPASSQGGGNMQVGGNSSGSQGSTGGIISPQEEGSPVIHFASAGIPIQEIDPTATRDAAPTDSGVPTGYGEPEVRASTTDSTRVPSSNSFDTDHGGNVH